MKVLYILSYQMKIKFTFIESLGVRLILFNEIKACFKSRYKPFLKGWLKK